MTLKWQAAQAAAEAKTHTQQEIDNYTRASGKMLLLHKLLPKLRAEGRQVSTMPALLVSLLLDLNPLHSIQCPMPSEVCISLVLVSCKQQHAVPDA
jgi:hypothetical protein